MQITIIGAGAIGGTTGAFLSQAGHEVTLVDVVLEHVQLLNEQGVHLIGVRGDHFYPVRALLPEELTGPLGTVILAVKTHFTEDAMRQYGPLLASDGYVVSMQNGLNEEIIARHVGNERTIGAFVHFGADYLEPGLIQLGQEHDIFLGELNGEITPRLEELQGVLSAVMPTNLTSNIWGYLWGKLVYGTMSFVISCVDAPVPEVLANPLARRVARAAASETARVGAAQGYRLEPIGPFEPIDFLPGPGWEARANGSLDRIVDEMANSIKQHTGVWRDLRIKRRKTEVERHAEVAARGESLGIAMPLNRAIVALVHEIEQGERGMGWDNLDVLAAQIPDEELSV
ncbi:MAG TPA: 2-dehydropantoate 2-reductase [Nitrolancea sp.]|jgi:2-dehydropantoate 2-reductase|nr:2-dehydropantoate 2-reductase [Nitrolancea sp.]